MAGNLTYTIEDRDGVKILNLNGMVSNATKDILSGIITILTQRGNLIINMRDVDFVTSSGFGALANIILDSKQKSKKVLLAGVKEDVVNTVSCLDMHHCITLIDSIEDGLMKLKYYT